MMSELPRYDLVVIDVRVIDPATGLDGRAEVAISGGRIAAIAPELPPHQAGRTIDATEERYLTSVRGSQRNLIAAAGGLAEGRMVFANLN